MSMGWIYIIALAIALLLLCLINWLESEAITRLNKEKFRERQKAVQEAIRKNEESLRLIMNQQHNPNLIQTDKKSILFEEMKERHKNRELKDFNEEEEEDYIEKLLREARSRK